MPVQAGQNADKGTVQDVFLFSPPARFPSTVESPGKIQAPQRRTGFRAARFLQNCFSRRDWGGLAMVAAVAMIAAWLVCLPFSTAVQQTTINRFHLATRSFAAWAVQQPIPPMYNLENRYWLAHQRLTPDQLVVPPAVGIKTGMVNHFPTRLATFADSRARMMQNPLETWLYVRSRYQSQQRTTEWRLRPDDGGGWVLTGGPLE